MKSLARLSVVALAAGMVLSGCSFGGGGGSGTYHAVFSRAVQLFPAGKVRVLGVDVGHIVSVQNGSGGVDVTIKIDRGDVKLPFDVKAAIVPASLLGERYIQLFPAYRTGPALPNGSTIPESRTAVPVEPDEVLRSLQDYLGALDPNTVTKFVENAATILNGNGEELNSLIAHGADVMATLSAKREDLASLITELNDLTQTLATRQRSIGQLIQTYDTVASTLNDNRSALEGTITGLNEAAAQLAGLLTDHQATLVKDIQSLTRTGRTLDKNVGQLTGTGHYATLLFSAASRAVDYNHNWLRLGNQGQELGALILLRLEERLQMLCVQSGSAKCVSSSYWSTHVPQLFCFIGKCGGAKRSGSASGSGSESGAGFTSTSAAGALAKAIDGLPKVRAAIVQSSAQAGGTSSEGGDASVQDLVDMLLAQTLGDPYGLGGLAP